MKIGIFDSGIGGLTVYKEVRQAMPAADIHYVGDTARVPYGTKSAATVTRYAVEISRYLCDRDVDAIVVACNTASAFAVDVLRETVDVPVFSVVGPGARAAVSASAGGRIGVVGTGGTIGSGAYQRAITDLMPGAVVVAVSCPLLVPLVEEGWLMDPITQEVAIRYLKPLMAEEVDTLVLGCTHYPLLKDLISRIMGEEVSLIDSAEETAAETRAALKERGLPIEQGGGTDVFEVTDSAERFARVGRIFLCREIEGVRQTSIGEPEA